MDKVHSDAYCDGRCCCVLLRGTAGQAQLIDSSVMHTGFLSAYPIPTCHISPSNRSRPSAYVFLREGGRRGLMHLFISWITFGRLPRRRDYSTLRGCYVYYVAFGCVALSIWRFCIWCKVHSLGSVSCTVTCRSLRYHPITIRCKLKEGG